MTEQEKTFTRKEYMDHKCTHREYYSQYVNSWVRQEVHTVIGVDKLKNSKDEHFNDIPLKRWDVISMPYDVHDKMKANGDYLTQAGIVCIAKEAARQIVEDDIK